MSTIAMFSPLAFPEGLVLYDLVTALPSAADLALAPFEIYREPLAIVGIADGNELIVDSAEESYSKIGDDTDARIEEYTSNKYTIGSLSRDLEGLRWEYSRALLHQALIFDHDPSPLPKDIYPVPSLEKSRTTTVKTVMCDLTSRLLAEMALFGKSLQALTSIDTPKVPAGSIVLNGTVSASPAHMAEFSRSGSAIENSRTRSTVDNRPSSTQRMSMPANMYLGSSSQMTTGDGRAESSIDGGAIPPTNLNETIGNTATQSPPKPSSHGNLRPGSSDKISLNGTGIGTLSERERTKGKCRVGVVVGAMYLLAGRWPDAVKELTQSATVARSNSDYAWYAKALDYMLVCLLMYAWAGMDFRVSLHNIHWNDLPKLAKRSRNEAESSRYPTSSSQTWRGSIQAHQNRWDTLPPTVCPT